MTTLKNFISYIKYFLNFNLNLKLYIQFCPIFPIQVEGSVDVNISTEQNVEETQKAKEAPAWLSEAASLITTKITDEKDDVEVRNNKKILICS